MPENPQIPKISPKEISDTDKHIRLSDYIMHIHSMFNRIRVMKDVGYELKLKEIEEELFNIETLINTARNSLEEKGLSIEDLIQISSKINKLIVENPNIFGSININKEWL